MIKYAILLVVIIVGTAALVMEGRGSTNVQQQFSSRELGESVHLDTLSSRTPTSIIEAVRSAAAAKGDHRGVLNPFRQLTANAAAPRVSEDGTHQAATPLVGSMPGTIVSDSAQASAGVIGTPFQLTHEDTSSSPDAPVNPNFAGTPFESAHKLSQQQPSPISPNFVGTPFAAAHVAAANRSQND